MKQFSPISTVSSASNSVNSKDFADWNALLLKLIDRETEYTAYEVLKEFRGGFVAGFWQSVSRIFGQNLKSEYDREGDDKVLEQIVLYYEAGLL